MIKISKANLDDLEAILQLQYVAYQSQALIYPDFTIQPLTQTLDEVIAEYHRGVILKAVSNGEIIGSVRAYADGDTVYIGKLMVHPNYQGKGLGKRLLSSVESVLHRKRFELFTGYKSEGNLRLYEVAGYTRFKEETDAVGIVEVYLEKRYDDGANIALGICFGLLFGAVIGVLMDNIGFWMPIGLCFGVAFGVIFHVKKPKMLYRTKAQTLGGSTKVL
jgi:GNAT superfamily N-acetyltransferase